MTAVSILRLNLLRAGYLLLVVGLGLTIWPSILQIEHSWELRQGVVICMLGALSALALLGLRHPLRMLPILFFEMAWKLLWLSRVALPLWSTRHLDAATAARYLYGSRGLPQPFSELPHQPDELIEIVFGPFLE